MPCPAHLGCIKRCQCSLSGTSRSQPACCYIACPPLQHPPLPSTGIVPLGFHNPSQAVWFSLTHHIALSLHSLHPPHLRLQVPLTTLLIPSSSAPHSVPCGRFVPLLQQRSRVSQTHTRSTARAQRALSSSGIKDGTRLYGINAPSHSPVPAGTADPAAYRTGSAGHGPGVAKGRNAAWQGRDTGAPRCAQRSKAAEGNREPGLRTPPPRPSPAHRTRLTSPFLQLVNRSLVSMAGAGRGAAAPH